MPEFGNVSVEAIDPDLTDDYFLHVTDFLTPTRWRSARWVPALPRNSSSFLRSSMRNHWRSRSTRPSPPTEPASPTSRLPARTSSRTAITRRCSTGTAGSRSRCFRRTDPAVGAAWLEKGGVYVVANIRGGGEFGPKWHQSALKANRYRAYDDFIAVAEDLVRRKVTSPAHLGIQGGSNGGLLMGNMLVRKPDLFGAIVCQVPLLDMRRFNHLLAGASWMGEYGNPDLPEEWAFIRTFLAVSHRREIGEISAHAFHDLDPRRPRSSRTRAKNGGQDEGPGARRGLLREHRRWPRRRRRQQAGGVHAGTGLYVSLERAREMNLGAGSSSEAPETAAAYRDDLAYIHDAGFGGFARQAGQVLVDALVRTRDHRRARDRPGLRQRDPLRSGHGAGYRALGIDISEGMVALARKHVPQAKFRVESLLSAALPNCVAVAAVGECLNYLFDEGNTTPTLVKLFRRIYCALEPSGLFILDVAGPGRVSGTGPYRAHVEGAIGPFS